MRALSGRVPIVLLNRRLTPFPSVTLDAASGITQALLHLVALGHKRVAYVAGPRTSWANRERLRGLRTAAGPRPLDARRPQNLDMMGRRPAPAARAPTKRPPRISGSQPRAGRWERSTTG